MFSLQQGYWKQVVKQLNTGQHCLLRTWLGPRTWPAVDASLLHAQALRAQAGVRTCVCAI